MKSTGIVRRIDDLGRIVIPKEIRRNLRIRNGENIEIFIEEPDKIIFKKYSPMASINDFAKEYAESIYSKINHSILITDRDNFIAGAGPLKKKYLNKKISPDLENTIVRRSGIIERHKKEIELSSEKSEEATYSISPILSNGDSVGLVIILSLEDDLTELEEKLSSISATFLGKYIED